MWRFVCASLATLFGVAQPALAGPPFVSDDPVPTDYKHFEIYAFTNGATNRDDTGGAAGIDFNYGATPNLQLTFAVPIGYDRPTEGKTAFALGNIEIAAKYRFLNQETFGWDVAVFPRLFLPSGSAAVGERHASFLLPIWIGKDWGRWSTFGGGGCVINRGGGSQDFCVVGWTVTRQVLPGLRMGAEVFHQTADARGGQASTGVGAGAIYNWSENYHLLAYAAPGIQNAAQTNRYSWYSAFLVTF